MKRLIVVIIVTAAAAALSLTPDRADEGMWRPRQIPLLRDRLESMGMAIAPDRLGDLLDYPMNAVISLGGCTASFVSPDGLVITNHHCAYRTIQHNSTADRNLIETGFLARSRADELPASPGTRVFVTVKVEDVTRRVTEGLTPRMSGRDRYQAIEDRTKDLVARCEEDPGHRCRVARYNGGLEFELIKQIEIRDVRLVHAPNGSIGKYGGDVDNWMWPRHTGDYSFYRAYVGKDGKPADHSDDNVPYRPKHYLKVSAEGVEDGDLVFVAGYPGTTNRYRTAAEVEKTFAWYYPARIRAYRRWLDIIATETAGKPEAAVKYASLVSSLNNGKKNNEGMIDAYGRGRMLEDKRRLEADLQRWIAADASRGAKYQPAIDELRDLVAREQSTDERGFYYENLIRRSALLDAARTIYRLSVEKQKPDADREPGYQDRDLSRIREKLVRMDRSFVPEVDRAFWRQFILDYAAIPVGQHVKDFDEWFGIEGNDVDEQRLDARLTEMYARTTLGDGGRRLDLMEADRAGIEANDDPFLRLAVRLFPSDMELEERQKDLDGGFLAARPRFMEALIAFTASQGLPVYPDANGTLRVTYGSVSGYRPRDGVVYTAFTSLDGILEKDTGKDPFDAPQAQIAAVRDRRYGAWADAALGSVPVNFLTTLDSTGGNSGSPTLNARGELVGLLFDGTWEGVISSWDFMPDVSRSIHVDMRYVLWVMDEIAGAHDLMREMGVRPASAGHAATGSSLGGGAE